ncbi:MAG: hypothetical protein KBF35_01130 [Saprospiraceae bacterium]|jgi:hypothetical protein|nr:hypothetical protein [Saprospiraceae bacterium]
MHIKHKNILILVVLFFFTSCRLDGDQLSPEEKNTVDTLYTNQLNEWRNKIDSICNAEKDTIFVQLVDSLKSERMEEIEMLLMKNHVTE